MRFFTFGFLALAVFTATMLHFDRMSPMAMDLVEIESSLGLPLPAVLGLGALISWMWEKMSTGPSRDYTGPGTPRSEASRATGGSETSNTFDTDGDWLDQIKSSARAIPLPTGARLNLDTSRPCPIELRLDQAPPERARRAIGLVAEWIGSIPTPPRARVTFDHCPDGGSPRHHQVAGALAEHMGRGHFKTLADLDAVDIIFHHPDSRWKK